MSKDKGGVIVTSTNKSVKYFNSLNKELEKFRVMLPSRNDQHIDNCVKYSTGINSVDQLLNGGLPKGHIVGFGAEYGVGKTTLLLQICGNIIREYGHEIYPEGGKYDWDWDSESNRAKFNSTRIKSINYEKYTGFVLAGMILNRVVSLVDVILLERRTNTRVSSVIVPKGYDGMELQLFVKF